MLISRFGIISQILGNESNRPAQQNEAFPQFFPIWENLEIQQVHTTIYLAQQQSNLLCCCFLGRTYAAPRSIRDGGHRLRYVPFGKSIQVINAHAASKYNSSINAYRLRARSARRHRHPLCIHASENSKGLYASQEPCLRDRLFRLRAGRLLPDDLHHDLLARLRQSASCNRRQALPLALLALP